LIRWRLTIETFRVSFEFKACAVQVFPAREAELANPEVEVKREILILENGGI
jgi:hypothetical protein